MWGTSTSAPEEAGDALRVLVDVLGVRGFGDGPAVAEDNHIWIDLLRRIVHGLYPLGGLLQVQGRLRADIPLGGQPHVGHQQVGAGLGHGHGVLLAEDIGAGEHVELVGQSDRLDLQVVTHPRLLQVLAEDTVDQPHGGEVLDPIEAYLLQLP